MLSCPLRAAGVPSPPVHPCRPRSLHQLQAEKESGGRNWGGGEGRMNLQAPTKGNLLLEYSNQPQQRKNFVFFYFREKFWQKH